MADSGWSIYDLDPDTGLYRCYQAFQNTLEPEGDPKGTHPGLEGEASAGADEELEAGMSTADTPWRDPSRLTQADKARLAGISDRKARQLDVTSDAHEYVWGFRQARPGEEHRMRLGEASATRAEWHQRLAEAGHTMAWQLYDQGAGASPSWKGLCTDCGANMNAGYLQTSQWRAGKDARDAPCSGPGTAWQDEMLREHQEAVTAGAIAVFGQALKIIADQQWLQDQGIGPGEPGMEAG